ncbi:MAG: hypothetical protein FJZ63_02870, partial [Chlamydiae bacterium]|nr:hypothetical protein [Chlamydiota bacterium]
MATRTDASHHLTRQILNIVAYVAFVVVGVCSGVLPFNNNYFMDVVSRYNPDFMVPAYAWYVLNLVVFVFLLCFVIYQAMAHKRNDRSLRSVDFFFLAYVIAHILWTFGFFYNIQPLAFVSMVIGAFSIIMIYHRLGIGQDRVTRTHYWCVHFPFSILTAGALFAAVAQIAIFCIRYNLVWWGVGQVAWTVIAILAIALVGSLFLLNRPDVGFGATLVWLSAGLAVYQNSQTPVVASFAYLLTLYFAIITYANGLHRP